MERYDLSYPVALPSNHDDDPLSLVAQLVSDNRPDINAVWSRGVAPGEIEQQQTCRIVDTRSVEANAATTNAEGLFYRLIVRLHKFSLGRTDYRQSVHWQRGLVLDYGYNGRALLEHVGNDIRITVRAAYPEYFLSVLTT